MDEACHGDKELCGRSSRRMADLRKRLLALRSQSGNADDLVLGEFGTRVWKGITCEHCVLEMSGPARLTNNRGPTMSDTKKRARSTVALQRRCCLPAADPIPNCRTPEPQMRPAHTQQRTKYILTEVSANSGAETHVAMFLAATAREPKWFHFGMS